MDKKRAYRIVIADLEKNVKCSDAVFTIGCYECGLRLVHESLKTHARWLDL